MNLSTELASLSPQQLRTLTAELMAQISQKNWELRYRQTCIEQLTRYLDDGHAPVDNNWLENQIRPWATGRKNWLFAGSLRAGQRAAVIMSLIRSAQLNGRDPFLYLKDVLTRLPIQRAKDIEHLLLHRWKPLSITA